jgi:hypothetical protein
MAASSSKMLQIARNMERTAAQKKHPKRKHNFFPKQWSLLSMFSDILIPSHEVMKSMGFPAEDVSNMLTRDKNQAGVERPIEVTNWEIDRNRTLMWVDRGLTMKLYWVFLALFRMSFTREQQKDAAP